jgi:hypothetical protein
MTIKGKKQNSKDTADLLVVHHDKATHTQTKTNANFQRRQNRAQRRNISLSKKTNKQGRLKNLSVVYYRTK